MRRFAARGERAVGRVLFEHPSIAAKQQGNGTTQREATIASPVPECELLVEPDSGAMPLHWFEAPLA
jgi:hypothetical protein